MLRPFVSVSERGCWDSTAWQGRGLLPPYTSKVVSLCIVSIALPSCFFSVDFAGL